MLKKIYTIGLSVCLALIILTASGCKTTKKMVYAEYIMPPIAFSDVASIERINIDKPKIKISGVGKRTSKSIRNVFTNTIVNDFSSKLYFNGYIKPSDEIYGDIEGLKAVRKKLAHSKHGYAVKIVKVRKPAKLKVYATINYKRTKGVDKINTTLVTQSYSIITNKNGVPCTKANKPTKKVVTNKVSYIEVKAKGSLVCTLYDCSGKKLYSRKFDDLEFENKAGGDAGSNSEAPYLEVAQNLFNDAISKVVMDISPHRESRSLLVNEKGDSSVVALIKGTAFYDAFNKLGPIVEAEEKTMDKLSAEINSKYDQLITNAEDPEKKADLEQKRTNDLIDITKDYSPDYENMAIILEIIGDRNEALEYYEMAAKADPENIRASESCLRVQKLVAASSCLKNPNKINNYQQKKYEDQ
ncbi:hypothetical protein SAMN05660337_1275 [Maridesulfovibrio ferrireducens]|uniref:Uncharacterized protein n=1 Tax=Maridesulfovibrio ferrireducens TaxID=246191 RepID=A0A1G9EUZ5_9BACT|nr:hypothetical protein [Maridesulfovibrio ferrireducens]SDK79903.1 hypothetical protein SAMN05660337_1275 [Maridesulfovibrio ferrireducens]